MIRLFEQRPERFLRFLLIAQLILWTAVPALTYASAPLDVVENIGWGREWQWGYYKHPPLQAWLSYAGWLAGHGRVWPIYLMSQLCVVLTQLGLFALAKDIAGGKRALWAVVLYSVVYYATLSSPEFNLNVIQMPLWMWSAFALRRALLERPLRWWLLLAVLLAATLYTKYSVIVLVGTLGVALFSQPKGRASLKTPWPWVAGAVCAALCAPQLIWLQSVNYLPLTFTAEVNETGGFLDNLKGIFAFLGGQALDQIVVVVLLLIAGAKLSPASSTAAGFDDRRFAAVLAIAPFALTILMSLVSQIGLRDMWGAPMAAYVTLAAVVFLDPAPKPGRAKAVLAVWLAIFLLLPIGVGVAATYAGMRGGKPVKVALPGPQLVDSLDRVWSDQTATPLDIVAGETWPSGVVAAYSRDRPSVFVDGKWLYNPWITRERVESRGILVVWTGSDNPPPTLARLGPFQARGQVWARYRKGGKMAQFKWAIRAPGLPAPAGTP